MPTVQRRLAALLILLTLLASSGLVLAQDSTATSTPTATATATPLPTLTLQLFISRGSLTLYTPETVSLAGLTLVAVDQRPFIYTEAFDGLSLTGGISATESCFVLRDPTGAADPLASACREAAGAGRVFLLTISAADNFWFDPITNQPRALAIQRGESLLLTASGAPTLCPGGQPACEFAWPMEALPTATPSPTVKPPAIQTAAMPPATTAASAPAFPCTATTNVSNRSQVVRVEPNTTSMAIGWVNPNQEVTVEEVYTQGTRSRWYRIRNENGESNGWVEGRYLVLSTGCPA